MKSEPVCSFVQIPFQDRKQRLASLYALWTFIRQWALVFENKLILIH